VTTSGAERIGAIGLGLLGGAIVERLRAAGYELVGYDIDASRAAELGIEAAASPLAVARACGRIVLCLPDGAVVDDVLFGADGLVAGDELAVRCIVDATTSDPAGNERRDRELAARGIDYVEAAVSGSSAQMRAGDGVLLVGAAPSGTTGDAAIERVRDLLDALAPVVFCLGPVGAGARVKLLTNLVLGLQRLALAEGFAFADKLGVDAGVLAEVLRAGPAHSRALEAKGRKMVRGEFQPPQARLRQHLKDVRLMLDLAAELDAALPVSGLHRDLLEKGIAAGLGDEDNAAIVEILRREVAGHDGSAGRP